MNCAIRKVTAGKQPETLKVEGSLLWRKHP
jgi:hypothetical protein